MRLSVKSFKVLKKCVTEYDQARSQEFALGGGGRLLWRLEKVSNNLDPDFNRSLIRLSRFTVQTGPPRAGAGGYNDPGAHGL